MVRQGIADGVPWNIVRIFRVAKYALIEVRAISITPTQLRKLLLLILFYISMEGAR